MTRREYHKCDGGGGIARGDVDSADGGQRLVQLVQPGDVACSVAGLLIYVSMLIVGRPIKKDPNRRTHSGIVVEEEDDEEFIGGGGEAWMSLAGQHHQDGAYGTFTNKDRSA